MNISGTGVVKCECGGVHFGVVLDPLDGQVKLICRNTVRACGAIFSVGEAHP